jgi:hypothetical protein
MPTPPRPHQTPPTPRLTLALAMALTLLVLAACASTTYHPETTSSIPANRHATPTTPSSPAVNEHLAAGVLVRVGAHLITIQTLEHWIGVQAILEYQATPTRPVPAGVIPRPPSYYACTTHLAALAHTNHTPPAPTLTLKQQCQATYQTLRGQVLETLIAADWVTEEARKAHITLTPQETSRALHQRFPTHTALTRYLTLTKLTTTDETTLLNNELLLLKLQHTLPIYNRLRHAKNETGTMAGEIDAALAHLTTTITQTWTPKTHCQPPNLTPLCANH